MPANQHPLLASLSQKKLLAQKDFAKKHAFAQKWLEEKGLTAASIRKHSARLLAGATIGGALLLSSPNIPLLASQDISQAVKLDQSLEHFLARIGTLNSIGLSPTTEHEITESIKDLYGVSVAYELEGNRLPDYIGSMGLEQHLYRSSTDTLGAHDEFQQAGIAPARGAFGYFFEEGKSDEEALLQEKYYIVLQTFLIPEWNSDWATLKPWYKFRKFLVINKKTGTAVVAALGDSGPGVSTGKQFGGSPEVMAALGWYPGQTRGDVLVLYLDDPSGTVPLGPLATK